MGSVEYETFHFVAILDNTYEEMGALVRCKERGLEWASIRVSVTPVYSAHEETGVQVL